MGARWGFSPPVAADGFLRPKLPGECGLRRAVRWSATVLLLVASAAWADGLDSLAAFMQDARSGRAEFAQTVTSPPGADGLSRVKKSSGRFEFRRPREFRFDYRKPFEQIIVADGTTLWFYDADLNQVTERRQSQVLAQTPAALLASADNVQALERDFSLEAVPDRDGLQWVKAVPRMGDGQLQEVQVGFRGNTLAALEILDAFGQRSVLRFGDVETNVTLPPGAFRFEVPAGADVLRE